ncbi:MAG: hypothetical protein ACYSWU_13605 [Planctomycetota bacterium]
MTYDEKGALRYALRIYVFVAAFFCALAAVAGLASGDLSGMVLTFPCWILLAALVAAIQIPGFLWMAKLAVPKVTVQDGKVTTSRPNRRRLSSWTFPLSNCRWYLGKVRHDSFLRNTVTPNAPAIILVYPVHWWGFEVFRYKTACGLSGSSD